jgi:hypothetical protein
VYEPEGGRRLLHRPGDLARRALDPETTRRLIGPERSRSDRLALGDFD